MLEMLLFDYNKQHILKEIKESSECFAKQRKGAIK